MQNMRIFRSNSNPFISKHGAKLANYETKPVNKIFLVAYNFLNNGQVTAILLI